MSFVILLFKVVPLKTSFKAMFPIYNMEEAVATVSVLTVIHFMRPTRFRRFTKVSFARPPGVRLSSFDPPGTV